MRKRIVIGLLGLVAVAAIGVVAFVVSQPKRGSVEWHKREYISSFNGMLERRFKDKVKRLYVRVTKRRVPPMSDSERMVFEKDVNAQRKALADLGYIVDRTFTISNCPVIAVVDALMLPANVSKAGGPFTVAVVVNADRILISGPGTDVPKWEALIRRMDVPQGAK